MESQSQSISLDVLALESPNPDGAHASDSMSDDQTPIPPRIGPEFQVEIPKLPLPPYPVPADHPFLLGLPIPLFFHPTSPLNLLQQSETSPLNLFQRCETAPALPPRQTGWTELEEQGFILGLYIFGKNLKLVQRFVGSRGMGEVLVYYYGKRLSCKREQYKRWVECRKLVKTRRCVLGARIFTGWRQQEILARIQAELPQEGHLSLLEIFKSFNENTITFEEFVFSLKDKIGLELFTQTIGLGRGRYDLTGTGPDSTRSVNPVPTRPEIPAGKACSSLSSNEIIKYLTGDFRLSKARSNDLFWEAVWPRLLVTGWRSEEPKDLIGSKNSLVFIKPGIKKFSRSKLNKGEHYYDCVSDVLKKVAADPGLIEIDGVTVCSGSVSRPVNPKEIVRDREEGLLRFMVVDTSLLSEGERVREMRSLPSDAVLGFGSGSDFVGPGLTDGLSDFSDSADEKVKKKKRVKKENLQTGTKRMEGPVVGTGTSQVNGHVETDSDVNYQEGHFGNFGESSKPKSKHKYLSPITKRRKLNACKTDRKNATLLKESSNSESSSRNGSGLTSQQPARETDHPTRKRKVKFLVKDVMQEGAAIDASLCEMGQTGRDEAGQTGQTVPTEKRKRKINFLVREPPMAQEGNEIKQDFCEKIETVSEKTEIEPVRPVSEMGLTDKEIQPVSEEGSTKRRRKVTFLVREAMQVEKEGASSTDLVNGPEPGLNPTRFDSGLPVKEKEKVKRKPKSKSLTKDVKKQGKIKEGKNKEGRNKEGKNKGARHIFHRSVPDTVPSETGTRNVESLHIETKETKEPVQLTVPQVGPTGTSETKEETKPTEITIIKEEPQHCVTDVSKTGPTESRTKPSVPVPEPEPVRNESGTAGRRVGTRNRPPTVRALEAVASGLLGGPKQRNSHSPAASRRPRKTGEASRRSKKKDETVDEEVAELK